MQGTFIIGSGCDDAGRLPHFDQGHLAAAAEIVDDLARFRFGGSEAGWLDVAGLHGGGGIEQHNGVAAGKRGDGNKRPCQSKDQRSQNQQLQKEEQIAPQLLPRGIRFAVAHQLLPEEGAAHQHFAPPQAQHVEQDDGDGKEAKKEEGGC